jgi:hypothetical protein
MHFVVADIKRQPPTFALQQQNASTVKGHATVLLSPAFKRIFSNPASIFAARGILLFGALIKMIRVSKVCFGRFAQYQTPESSLSCVNLR